MMCHYIMVVLFIHVHIYIYTFICMYNDTNNTDDDNRPHPLEQKPGDPAADRGRRRPCCDRPQVIS